MSAGPSAAQRPRDSLQPAVFDLVFVLWAVVLPLGFHRRLLNSDGDLARHLRVGQWMLGHGSVLRTDIFSYPMAGRPLVPFEWLSEIAFTLAWRLGGLPGVAIFSGLLIGLIYALLARFLLRRGVDPLLAYLVTMAAAVGGAAHWLARPHLFTLLGTVLLLHLLEPRGRARLWPFALLFLFWANLHGGFLYGLGLIGVYLAGSLIEALERPRRSAALARARHLGAALLAGLLASLVTPSGTRLYTHLLGALAQPGVVNNTSEYLSPDFHGSTARIFLALLLLTIAAISLAGRRMSWPRLLAVLANLALALMARRNIPLYAATVLPLLALEYDDAWRRLPEFGVRRVFARDEARRRSGVWSAAITICMVTLALLHGRIGGRQLLPSGFDRRDFPVDAVARARQAGLRGRLFNEFLWGGYLIYSWPEQRVFIDGGSYDDKMVHAYAQILFRTPGWREALRRWDVSLVLVPPESALADELEADPEWSSWYRDSTAILLRRRERDAASR